MSWVLVFIVMGGQMEVQATGQFGPFESREMCGKLSKHLHDLPGMENRDKMMFGGCWPANKATAEAEAAEAAADEAARARYKAMGSKP